MTHLQIFKNFMDSTGFKYKEYKEGVYIVINIEVCDFKFLASTGELVYLVGND